MYHKPAHPMQYSFSLTQKLMSQTISHEFAIHPTKTYEGDKSHPHPAYSVNISRLSLVQTIIPVSTRLGRGEIPFF